MSQSNQKLTDTFLTHVSESDLISIVFKGPSGKNINIPVKYGQRPSTSISRKLTTKRDAL